MKTYYAIEKIGYGLKMVFVIKKIEKEIDSGSVVAHPLGKPFKTEMAARKAAFDAGIKIEKVGDFFHII